jgi:hypothetical protein
MELPYVPLVPEQVQCAVITVSGLVSVVEQFIAVIVHVYFVVIIYLSVLNAIMLAIRKLIVVMLNF